VLAGGERNSQLASAALFRARFGELLAAHFHLPSCALFILGLLSLMDAILDTSIAVIAEQLPVPEDVRLALLGKPSPLTPCFKLVLAYEAAAWAATEAICKEHNLDARTLQVAYLESLRWAKPLLSD